MHYGYSAAHLESDGHAEVDFALETINQGLTAKDSSDNLFFLMEIQSGSMVEQSAVNRWVVGSSPTSGAIK